MFEIATFGHRRVDNVWLHQRVRPLSESHQHTFNAHIQQPNTQLDNRLYLNIPIHSPISHPGPSNVPGYIAHAPSYYNCDSYTSS